MKKKLTSVITMCMAASLIFTTSGAVAFASEAEAEEPVEEENVEEENIEAETEEIEWSVEQIEALSDILTGVENKEFTAGTASKYDIHMGVDFDKDIVSGVLFNTADLDSSTPGEYDVTYFIYFNREALQDYMNENNIDAEEFSGLNDISEDCIEITVKGKVTVTSTNEEPVVEESTEEEIIVEEPTYEEPTYEDYTYEEPVESSNSSSGRTLVEVLTIYDCDGSGNGYYEYHYSDGSIEYEDFYGSGGSGSTYTNEEPNYEEPEYEEPEYEEPQEMPEE